jgi:hypothetical protein
VILLIGAGLASAKIIVRSLGQTGRFGRLLNLNGRKPDERGRTQVVVCDACGSRYRRLNLLVVLGARVGISRRRIFFPAPGAVPRLYRCVPELLLPPHLVNLAVVRAEPVSQNALNSMSTLIAISRDTGYADRLRKYRVICDGAEIGRISEGTSTEFAISPGPHCLLLKVDWCSSNEATFSIGTDQVLRFSCGSSLRGLRVLLAIYYLLFARKRYLWLRQDGL